MLIIIARHGNAQRHAATGRDTDRSLSPEGERQADHLGACLARLDPPPAVIVASPVGRARRTAEIMALHLGIAALIDDRLSTSGVGSDMLAVIEAYADSPCVCIVGHNPTCQVVVAALCHGPTATADRHRTGEAAILETDPTSLVGGARLIERIRLAD